MSDDLALEVNRMNTDLFIDADPLILVLRFNEKEPDGEGGYLRSDDMYTAPQKFRLIPQSDIMPQVRTPDGVTLTPSYVLLGNHDAVIPRWATFVIDTVLFRIVSPIRPDYSLLNVYERKADVARV